MDLVSILQELVRHPLPDEVFARTARALLRDSSSAGSQDAPTAPLQPEVPAVLEPELGARPPSSPRPPAKPAARSTGLERVTARTEDNSRTTVSFAGDYFAQAAHQLPGGKVELVALIKDLCRRSPAEVPNRSAWVQARLDERLSARRTAAPG